MKTSSKVTSESELAKNYEESRDLSGFEGGSTEQVEVRRNVTISVRFSDEEIALLRARAEAAGYKVTAYIRDAALQKAAPVDQRQLRLAVEAMKADMDQLLRAVKTQLTSRVT